MPKIDMLKGRKPVSQGGNLVPITNKEMAQDYQRRSVESRKRNKERLQSLKSFTEDLDKIGIDVGDKAPKGIDVLRFCMVQAIHDEDFELAASYAEKIAQFETPKLSSVSQDIEVFNAGELTDEELAEYEALVAAQEKDNDEDS